MLRTHYPLHPYTHELADRLGLLIWSEIPVYRVKTRGPQGAVGARALAVKELRRNIEANENHPSVMLWSIGNELSSQPGPGAGRLHQRRGQARQARWTRRGPVGLAVAGYPSVALPGRAYKPLDVLGLNDYFGWYPGPSGQIFDRTKLSGYLDAVRACYPDKALMVTEFGAEANRDGPVEEKGTWAFQQDFVNYHLGVFATKPWLSGAIYWALNEFWVRPGLGGRQPAPDAAAAPEGAAHYDGVRKPAWADVQRWYQASRRSSPKAREPVRVGVDDGLRAVAGADLGEDVVDVALDRRGADHEPLGDLGVGQALGDQAEHLDLARGEVVGQLGAARPARWPAPRRRGAGSPGRAPPRRGRRPRPRRGSAPRPRPWSGSRARRRAARRARRRRRRRW